MRPESYEKLSHVGHKHYKDTNFCSVIALASVTGMSFGKSRIKMEKLGRKHRKGSVVVDLLTAIKNRGYEYERIEGYRGHHVKTMGGKLKGKGNFIIIVRGHALAVMDGKINDWSENSCHRVVNVYMVKIFLKVLLMIQVMQSF